jgi:peptidoglycan/xylan/chitin deacetylase (PgdA/CDA1 family)
MLCVQVPAGREAERRYIVEVLLGEFLGLEHQLLVGPGATYRLEQEGKVLELPDCFLGMPEEHWLEPCSLPPQPLRSARPNLEALLARPEVPVLYGQDPLYRPTEQGGFLGLDVFGSAFFMLSRYEEVVRRERDSFDRFPARASLAYQEGFLDRPIINEYLELLFCAMRELWPGLQRKQRSFSVKVGHDVDEPYRYAIDSPYILARRCARDLSRRPTPAGILSTLTRIARVKAGNLAIDPYDTFDRIMDLGERLNLKSAFYFFAHSGPDDGQYNVLHPCIRSLARKIHRRGHEVGLHASFATYDNPDQMTLEVRRLVSIMAEEGVRQERWGNRQHYLRWKTPNTFENLERAGISYDATLGYPERIGFRCGVCYDYPAFSLGQRRALKLRVHPLTAMEISVFHYPYMNLGTTPRALQAMLALKATCRRFEGEFRLLWHNNTLASPVEFDLYRGLLEA